MNEGLDGFLGAVAFKLSKPGDKNFDGGGALKIDISGPNVAILLNSNKKYRTLAQKDLIVAGLNKELIKLMQAEIENLAALEEQREAER